MPQIWKQNSRIQNPPFLGKIRLSHSFITTAEEFGHTSRSLLCFTTSPNKTLPQQLQSITILCTAEKHGKLQILLNIALLHWLQIKLSACTLLLLHGSFRVKKWGFERAVSKLVFLALNKLVGPHGVHWGQFWPPPAILGSIFTPGWLFGYVEHPKFQISFWSHFLWFCCPFCIQRDGISPLLMFKVQNRP